MGNRDLYYDHMSTQGSLAFNYDECHAYSMRGSIDLTLCRAKKVLPEVRPPTNIDHMVIYQIKPNGYWNG